MPMLWLRMPTAIPSRRWADNKRGDVFRFAIRNILWRMSEPLGCDEMWVARANEQPTPFPVLILARTNACGPIGFSGRNVAPQVGLVLRCRRDLVDDAVIYGGV